MVRTARSASVTPTLRANELQLAGYSVLQFSYDQVVHQPAMVIATVARALARRAAA